MKEYQTLLKDIKNNQILPIYFLQGEESYFIDKIANALENDVLPESDKEFGLNILYGLETDMEQIVSLAKQFPFGTDKQIVMVKEAQHLNFQKESNRDLLEAYAKNPQMQTVLVFLYKGKKLDGKIKLAKTLKSASYIYTSDKIWDNQLPQWIETIAKNLHLSIDLKSQNLLAEFMGTNLSAIENELKKLQMILGGKGEVTPDLIEKQIGISKDYNNFELSNAIATKNSSKAFQIVKYFEENPKNNPVVVTVSVLYGLFHKIILMHSLDDKSDASIAKTLGVNPHYKVLDGYKIAAQNYNIKAATKVLEYLQEVDLKSKGIGTTDSNNQELLREFVYKTIYSYQ